MSSVTAIDDRARLLAEAERAVDLARELGADDAVAGAREGQSIEYVYRDGRIEKVQENVGKALSVSIYVDGRYSVHSSNDLRSGPLRKFLADAVALTRELEPDPHRALPDPELYAGRRDDDLDLEDRGLESLDRERILEHLGAMDKASHTNERVLSSTSTIQRSSSVSGRASSNGFLGSHAGTSVAWVSEVTVDDEDARRPEAYAYAYARHLEDLPEPESISQEALRRALARLGSGKASSGAMTLVVDREAAGSLLGRVLGALSASSIQQKRSFLANHLGEPIAAPALSLTDDPHVRRGLASSTYDAEGIAAKKRAVIENGVLRTYFIDTYYGRKLGWEPTTGDPSNLLVHPGERSRDQLVEEAGSGIYVTSWAGGNADATTGDFSFGIQGHLLEGGRIGKPVSEMNVTGSFLDLMQKLVAVGNDPFPYSSLRTPTLVFENVQFSGG